MDLRVAEEVMTSISNWFEKSVERGSFSIKDGKLIGAGGFLADGQYYRIIGSVFNDGLHINPTEDLADEEFDGAVCGLAVPKAFQALVEEISELVEKDQKDGEGISGAYQSESFGGYSYTLPTDPATGNVVHGWEGAFASRLNQWRKLPLC